jgi:hypothetical protein
VYNLETFGSHSLEIMAFKTFKYISQKNRAYLFLKKFYFYLVTALKPKSPNFIGRGKDVNLVN